MSGVKKVRCQLEVDLNWADANPDLYTKSLKEFMAEYQGWKIFIDATRKNCAVFIARINEAAK